MPAVSIIIPTKNRGELMMQTLASVRAQTFGDWEAIVVDDQSTDDTLVRLQQVVLDEPRIRYVTVPKPRHGAQAARNIGIGESTGRYVMLLDSDDLLAPFCLEQRVPVMEADSSLDFAVFPCEIFRQTPGDVDLLWNVPTATPDLLRFLSLDVPWQTTSPLWRREALMKVMPWPEDVPIGQDWEFHIRALLAGLKYACTGRPDHYWRQAESERESIGKRYLKPEMLTSRVKVNERVLDHVRKADQLDNHARAAFVGMFFQSAERIAAKVSRKLAREVWQKAVSYGLINAKQARQGRTYFLLYQFPSLRNAYRRHLEKVWPAAFFAHRSKTYLNSPKKPPAGAAA